MPEGTDAARRAQLTEEREHLLEQLGHMGRAPRGASPAGEGDQENDELAFDEGFADSGQVTAERGEVDALATSLLEGLREIDDALAKFDDGTFGKCESCGKQIGEARLEAMPSARLCITCASRKWTDLGLQDALIYFPCIIVAIILHEISHGVVALWFGDDTAKKAGRLTLNPIPHIDPFGSLILPAFGAISGIPVIAWAKPVPVNPNQMRNPRANMLWVGLVGPFTNFALMFGSALVARSIYTGINNPFSELPLTFQIAFTFALTNLFLGVFNLLPIPPLDGSSLLERILPETWLPHWYRFRPYGMLVLFALVFFTPILSRVIEPFREDLVRFIVQ